MWQRVAVIVAGTFVLGGLWIVAAWSPEDADPEDGGAPDAVAAPPPRSASQPSAAGATAVPAPAPNAPGRLAEPPPAAPAPESPAPSDAMFTHDEGPVAEFKQRFEAAPRDSAANEAERAVRAAFLPSDGAPDLLKGVLCRQTICKLELRWAPDRLGAYVAGMTRVLAEYDNKTVAVTPVGPAGADTRLIEVYFERQTRPAAQP